MGSTLVATKSEEKKSTASARQDVDHNALLLQHAIGVPAGLPRFLSGGTAGGDGTTGGMRREPVPPDAPLPLDQAKSELEDGKTREAKPASGALAQARAAPASDAGRRDGAAGRRTPTPPTRVGGGARTARSAVPAAGPSVPAMHGKAPGRGEAGPTAMSAHEAIAPAVVAIHHRAAHARAHRRAAVPVASAQAAAITPHTEQRRSAATQTVTNLDAAKDQAKGQVARNEFKDKLKAAIVAATPKPKTEAEADNLMRSGATDARATMRGNLASERDAATGPLKSQSAPGADLPASSQAAPPQTSLQPEPIGTPPAPVSPASVVPQPLPPERLDYSSDREPADRAMAENNITKQQLQKGNEPEFGQTLDARATAEKHEAAAATSYRQSEGKVQDQAQHAAQAELAKGLGAMHGSRLLHVNQVVGKQFGTAAKNALERQRITETINGIKDKTRADVAGILSSMETEAETIFEAGLRGAEKAYEDTFEEEKGGTWTWLTTWGSDWEELIERSLDKARSKYLQQVDVAIDQVADLVDSKLAAAKRRVAEGRAQVDTFRNSLDTNVQHFADEAIEAVSVDFDAMGAEIDQRRDALVDKLAQQYKASYERMSAMEEKLREENKSLWQRIYDATVGLIKKILAFKDMLLSILAKAASVVVDIISDPIGFLGNLVSGVMQGLKNFMSNIGAHLKKGLMEWLFGALAGGGLQLPDTFDLKAIVSIVLQVLGLTYANFRARAVAIVGEPVVAALEKTAEIFKIIATEGISGLWNFIKDKVGDLKSLVLDAIFDFIKERVIIAGITWIIGLLNPVSAFFKACKAIYDIVMFFINRGSQIIDLVNAIIDSIASIAKGALGVAVTMVENALAKAIPVAIGFLASLLGLGDIGGTVRKTIDKAQSPVNKAIDWAISGAVKLFKAAGGFIKGVLGGKKDIEKDKAAVTVEGANVSLAVPLEMHGEGHTIYTEIRDGRLSVEIASSQRAQLLALTARAISQTENKMAVKRLERVHEKLKGAEEKVARLISDRAKDAEALAEADKMTHDAANTLKSIGQEFGIPSLMVLPHKSMFVEATVTGYRLRKEHKKDIRDRFYPTGYEPSTRAWKRQFIAQNTDPKNSANFIDHMGRSEPKSEATIDHQPRVVEHWESEGKRVTQSERAMWYSHHAGGHLSVVAGKYNFSDGAEARRLGLRYSPDNIGKGFLGPGEA